jgi:hypothetical protein
MNYINHINSIFTAFCEDNRITASHISLYHCLFQYWNMARFKNPISIARSELMFIAKISNANTYIKCIKELSELGYIRYEPSFNPSKGSLVYLYEFDNGIDKAKNKGVDNGIDNSFNNAENKAKNNGFVILNTPSINNTQTNTTNNTKTENIFLSKNILAKKQISNKSENFSEKEEKIEIDGNTEKEKLRQKKKACTERSRSVIFLSPSLETVKIFFNQNTWQSTDAEHFFNHFESNGWLVSGKTPMKNWHAAARNWMLNAQKFAAQKNVVFNPSQKVTSSESLRAQSRSLHVNQNKNYAEPL